MKKVANDFDNKNSHSSIKLQALENVKYPRKHKDNSRSKYLPKDFGHPIRCHQKQYDYHISVGKSFKYQPDFYVSHEMVNDVKSGFSSTADRLCGFWVLAHLIYKDQNKFPLKKIIQHGSQLDHSNTSNISNTNTNTNTNFISSASTQTILTLPQQSFFYLPFPTIKLNNNNNL
ncbi:hypothetical protein PHYBLDRAFT_140200 [Phycomyces blakesleeanus NRRL 1555(-)]|uniref:Uncharacterized protein n=1 Tax=Phycomyces blakesleeanus (strain ATCC 8743b / DSM 1359 / FGSC 10004 / NBRC 33097 / NRRL 1555) TaxID=763407 RepID=A0A167QSN9_PHYB8|nr:hypothetical protein PHYBLDRAFT_140200 [Phycomyces blakesleeanus NRRL 1555(-)]OAD80197.1 hypothetical protein PHYBLDRAFT_140200 [Phycomyces blakesleeanus NRRL 1555(-)]|eukprot:XP_018298237.1 hypothetical protein PHYBLDRAFT_140200 [Phycomyces blakesleeanus NRRL 1555(-)]